MCDSNSKPKFKAGDKVRCSKVTTAEGVDINGVYTIKNPTLHKSDCYGNKVLWHVELEEVKSTPSEYCFELVVEDIHKQTPKNYRELTPNTLIDISIDGNEFKVPLGDLIHTEHLLGVATGTYGYNIWKGFNEVLDKEKTLLNNQVYSRNDTFEQQRELIKIYFIDKEKEAKKQALKDVIEKQREEISNLEKELSKLDES